MGCKNEDKLPVIKELVESMDDLIDGTEYSLKMVDQFIREAVDKANPIRPCIVTARARKEVAKKLYHLPRLCEELEQAEGLEALLISQEICRIKSALESISQDPYYSLIPAKFFRGATERLSATICSCDKTTAWRNRERLLDALALRLFGVDAWV